MKGSGAPPICPPRIAFLRSRESNQRKTFSGVLDKRSGSSPGGEEGCGVGEEPFIRRSGGLGGRGEKPGGRRSIYEVGGRASVKMAQGDKEDMGGMERW